MVSWAEAYFQEGPRTIDSFCFLYVKAFGNHERVDVEKETNLMFLNKDECSYAVRG